MILAPASICPASEGVIWRRTLSAPLSWMLTYVSVRSASRQGRFRVLHPNIALGLRKRPPATCFVKAPFRNAVTYEKVRSLLRKGLFRASHPNDGVGLGIESIFEYARNFERVKFESDVHSFGDGLTYTYSEKFNVHLERACLNYTSLFRRRIWSRRAATI